MKIASISVCLLTMASSAYADSYYVSGSASESLGTVEYSCEVAKNAGTFQAAIAAKSFWVEHYQSWIIENDPENLLLKDANYWAAWPAKYGDLGGSTSSGGKGACTYEATVTIKMHPKVDTNNPNCANWMWSNHPELGSQGAAQYCSASGLIEVDKIPKFFECVREQKQGSLEEVQNRCLRRTDSYLIGLSQLKPELSDSELVRIGSADRKLHLSPAGDDMVFDYQACIQNRLQTSSNPLTLIESCASYASLRKEAKGSHCIAEVFKNQGEWTSSEVSSLCTYNDLLPLDFNLDYTSCVIRESVHKTSGEAKQVCSAVLYTDIRSCHDTLVLNRQFREKEAIQVCTASLRIKHLSENDPYQQCVLAESFLSKDPLRIIRRCYSETTLSPGVSCLNRVAKLSDAFADNPAATEALCTGFARITVDSSETYTKCIMRKVAKGLVKHATMADDMQGLKHISDKCL